MKYHFTKQSPDCDNLILIFAGWSTDHRLYAHINHVGWDVLVCYDYDDFIFDESLVEKYSTIYLYAWSLGVIAAAHSLGKVSLTRAFAVNGTVHPVDATIGIDPDIYMGTLEHLNEKNLFRFQRRIFSHLQLLQDSLPLLPESYDIEAMKGQLAFIAEKSPGKDPGHVDWTRIYISDEDRIFGYEQQMEAWKGHSNIVVLKGQPHYVDINDLVKATVPDTSIQAARFHRALGTYDENADAQRCIANRLLQHFADIEPRRHGSVLEIGPGTGIFTFRYMPMICPDEAVFMELYPINRFNLAPKESYYVEDAEHGVSLGIGQITFDYILSASSIQWFANQRLFFKNAASLLKDDGALVCSSFLPGTLSELDAVRPPMVYIPLEKLRGYLEEAFEEVDIWDETIHIYFKSARQAILHLKSTGVAGGMKSHESLGNVLGAVPFDTERSLYYLSFHPVYIIARKPKR